jgi:hypothetical protein
MSSPEEEAPKKKKKRSLLSPLRGRSLPARAALVLALFLVILVVVTWTLFFLSPIHVPWRHGLWWTRIAIVAVLLVVTPLMFYWALRLWTVRYRSRFPDIDFAWAAGVQAIQRSGLSLRSTPLFVILGPPTRELEQAMIEACGREFTVRGVPEGPAPLHWYANAEAIYLVCNEIGWLSRVNRVVQRQLPQAETPLPAAAAEPQTALDET